ncbi:MAG: D-alanyl-D-alanine carboxypeptidase/D-alanyl-D-alanine-endopeptidase [Aeromonadaceae bacterium]|nr:D-alanyl-D-alanine carboxypeptidase/D-alanyl-D-alanine-endopeptidase [Aeromonadaceae bacterium]
MLKKVLVGLCALPLLAHASIQAPAGARVALAYNEPGQTGSQGVHADAFMIPASTQKVLTALAATLYLGKEWRFKTRLLAPAGALAQAKQTGVLQGDLVLEFNGAPDLTRQALVNLLAYLKQQGVNQIQGNLLLDTGNYAGYDRGNGWSWNDLSICFTAPASAVIVDRNCVYAQLEAKQIGATAQPKVPAGQPIQVTSEAKVVALKEYYAGCELRVDMNTGNNYHLTGCIPPEQQGKPWPLSFAIQDPTAWGESLSAWALAKAGLTLTGQVTAVRHAPANLEEIAHLPSAPLSKLMDRMLKKSDNLYADAIARALGHRYLNRPASYATGAEAIRLILKHKAGIDLGSALLADGSGLSAHNLITANQMLQVLDYMALHDAELGLIDLLPVAGMSGTLGSRGSVQRPPLLKNVTAKTGTLQNVSNLAGYLTTASGKRKAFVLMVNGLTFPPQVRQALKARRISSPHYPFERAVLEQIYKEQPVQITD